MKHRGSDLPPELEAFLTPRRLKRRLPEEQRARALARARVSLAAGGETPAPGRGRAEVKPLRAVRGRSWARVGLAASAVVVAGTIWVATTFRGRPAGGPIAEPPPTVAPGAVPAKPPGDPVPVGPARTRVAPSGGLVRRERRAVALDADPFAVELALLQRAQTAYTRHDFAGALVLLTEHARRFPAGRLAEEREALRIRSLLACGRRDEARRAAASFAVRFPRSALLSRLERDESAPP